MQDQIEDLKSDLENEKDNVKNLKAERAKMFKQIEDLEKHKKANEDN